MVLMMKCFLSDNDFQHWYLAAVSIVSIIYNHRYDHSSNLLCRLPVCKPSQWWYKLEVRKLLDGQHSIYYVIAIIYQLWFKHRVLRRRAL